MNRGLRLWRAALFVAAAGGAGSAGAQSTLIYFNSQPGDYVGGGGQQMLTTLNGTFTVYRNFDNGVHVGFDGSTWWDVDFAAPHDAALTTGVYDGALRWPFHSPTGPGLDFSGDGRGCNELTGRFVVYEATFAPNGDVQAFAADLEQHCEGAAPALFASVRVNSTIGVASRLSVSSIELMEGEFGTRQAVFAVALLQPSASSVTVNYATANGTALAGSDYVATAGTLTFPPGTSVRTVSVQVRGDTLPEGTEFFFLDLSAPAGASIPFPRGTARLVADEGPDTFLYFDSEPGDYIGGAQTFVRTALDGRFAIDLTFDNSVHVAFDGSTWWDLYFGGPNGAPLAPGFYENAERWPFQSLGRPALDVGGDGRGCNELAGRFVILEVAYGPSGLSRFAADFEQHCEGMTPALYGSIRYNSLVDPRAWRPVGAGDFDGDGLSDVLWRHGGDGRLSAWLMDGATRRRNKPLEPWRLADLNWRVVGVGDFLLDGQPDLLWRHAVSGKVVVWGMNGLVRTAGLYLTPAQPADANWLPAAVGDFDGDLDPDILWRNANSGKLVLWQMNGTVRASSGFTNPPSVGDLQWQVRGAGDFNADGKADILWRHDGSGAVVVWYMDGPSRLAGLFTTPDRWSDLSWSPVATGHVDLSGGTDVVWRNSLTGQVWLWLMNGVVRQGEAEVTPNEFTLR